MWCELLPIPAPQMSPALQSHVWSTIGRAEGVLDLLLDLFVQEGCATEADSPMVDTLASCCVPLAASGGRVSGRVIKRILKVGGGRVYLGWECTVMCCYPSPHPPPTGAGEDA